MPVDDDSPVFSKLFLFNVGYVGSRIPYGPLFWRLGSQASS